MIELIGRLIWRILPVMCNVCRCFYFLFNQELFLKMFVYPFVMNIFITTSLESVTLAFVEIIFVL